MPDEILLKVLKSCYELLKDPEVKGIEITHGTDTMEEATYFFNLIVKSDKPVVLVGTMRLATAMSVDGPVNLLNAVKVAIDGESVGKGVRIAMNDTLNGARDVMKTNTTNVATFKSPDIGVWGLTSIGESQYFSQSTKVQTSKSESDVANLTKPPRVDIVYSHVSNDREMAEAAIVAGVKGIIHAGTGNGAIHDSCDVVLADAGQKGVAVVRSSRDGSGMTTKSIQKWADQGYLEGNTLNPQKARILS